MLQELNLPLNASSWSEEDLKDPKKLYEMTVLLNAQREIADQMLDVQWERKWRQDKVSHLTSSTGLTRHFVAGDMVYVSYFSHCHLFVKMMCV